MKEQMIQVLEESKANLKMRLEEEFDKLSDEEINEYLDAILKINEIIEELNI